jgi:hypothetical protein
MDAVAAWEDDPNEACGRVAFIKSGALKDDRQPVALGAPLGDIGRDFEF